MQKRNIRLKELGININKVYAPALEYLENCPRLNKNEVYEITTDNEGNQPSIFGNESNNKIFMIGDSSIECMYIRNSKKVHTVLEEILLKNGYDYEVKNLGTSGSQTLNIINLIINKLIDKTDSTVVVALPSNDEGPLLYEENYFSPHIYHATILPATERKVKRNTEINTEIYKRNLGLINAICNQLNLKLIFTSICYTTDAQHLKTINNIARDYCNINKIPFLDLEEEFQINSHFFYDKLHFLPEGSVFFAQKLFCFLKDQLIQNSTKNLELFKFNCSGMLEKNTIWSETISNINDRTKIKLVIDFDHLENTKTPALYAVDYFDIKTKVSLIKSENPDIGYYKYFSGQPHKRVEKVFNIEIPSDCKEIRVGIRKWDGKGIYIHNAFLSVLK
ncbi:SGNH/GDSL hydrolase family protein [Acinetobacter proteolyticus]|uniref:SGNH hydrolase-type esterase domain-containing protein n=1 Tax=Acinetobacter proteolyticus TaxID=1776741 RepID=A0A2N0WDT6_9GAMM|nr:SGNH/GDSL hydrolase family protein [Acinetobacter proteolyticus]PKF32868.1 hypothetical protein CW311_12565 [Acinetobacter proteolyticus]